MREVVKSIGKGKESTYKELWIPAFHVGEQASTLSKALIGSRIDCNHILNVEEVVRARLWMWDGVRCTV